MNTKYTQEEKAQQLHQLHHSDKLFILPNIWDVLGAKLLENIGYTAVATASASIAFTNGYNDGEKIPFNTVVSILRTVAESVNIPVTADIESGYAKTNEELKKNITQVIEAGIVGINIEDTNHSLHTLYTLDEQCERIRLIRKTADEMQISLFINARVDVLLHGKEFPTPEAKLGEMIRRGKAYREAGADCIFPITIKRKEDIREVVHQLQMPINVLAIPGIPDFVTLNTLGVTRVSLGPSFLKLAIKSMKTLALDLLEYRGLTTITENEITSDYLKSLVERHN